MKPFTDPAMGLPPRPVQSAPLATTRRRRLLLAGLGLALAPFSGLSGCAWFDSKQRQWALRPTPGRPTHLPGDEQLFRPGDQRWLVPVPAQAGDAMAERTADQAASQKTEPLALWWLPHARADAPALLYLHGTFRNLYQNLPKIDALRELGFSVLAVDYRGWGDSAPRVPDEASITADAATAWAALCQRQPLAARRVIYGHSMGGAVAVRLASGLRGVETGAGQPADYAALILESTFTRLPEVAASAGWVGRLASWLTTLEFDSLSRIARIDAPLLMLHGSADTTVPLALGRRLHAAAPPGSRFVEIAGGSHSRLFSDNPAVYRQAFLDFLPQLKP